MDTCMCVIVLASMAYSLLLLSQTQAKSALALKRVLKHQPTQDDAKSNTNSGGSTANDNKRQKQLTHKDRLRAAVRGALVTRKEEDISDSAFLGRATKGPVTAADEVTSSSSISAQNNTRTSVSRDAGTSTSTATQTNQNPVDDM